MPAIYRQISTEEFRSLEPGDDVYVTRDRAIRIFSMLKVEGIPDYLRCLFLKSVAIGSLEGADIKLYDEHSSDNSQAITSLLHLYVAVYPESFTLPTIKDISMKKGINDLFPGDTVYISTETIAKYIGFSPRSWSGEEKVACRFIEGIYRTDLVEITIIDRNFIRTDHTMKVQFNELIIP